MAGALTAAIASIFSGGVTADPYFEYTTLLLPGSGTNGAQNNTFLDGSTNNFTITRNGNTTQGTFSPFSQTGWGNYFDGTGDNITVPSSANLGLGTGDFTIECWVYNTAYTGTNNIFVDFRSGTADVQPCIFVTNTGVVAYFTNNANQISSSSSALNLNQWYHVALARSGTTTKLFLNGTQVGSNYTDTNNYGTPGSNRPMFAGNGSGLSDSYFAGYISNIRVLKGTALYTTTFTPPTSPLTAITNTQLLTCQSNRFIDNSSNNFTITRNGDTRVVAFSPFNPPASWSAATYGGSGYFDGSGDYLSTSASAISSVGANNFSFECFVYCTRQTNTYAQGLISYGISGDVAGTSYISFELNPSGYLSVAYATTAVLTLTDTALFPLNQWVHAVVCRSGSTLSLFVNGTRKATTSTSATVGSTGNVLYIGSQWYANDPLRQLQGYISNARILNGTSAYDATQTSITVPTAPLTAITNTSLLLNFTNAGIYDATSKNDLETVGDAQISNAITPKWGSTSIKFDGTGDWLLNQSPIPPTTFGSGDFSIEMWIYATTSGTQRWLFDGRIATPADGAYPAIYISSGNVLVYYVSAAARITGTTTITTNTWHFVQVIRTSGTTKMYLNGTQEGSNYTDSTVYANPGVSRPIIGAATNLVQPFTGYIQDLRVTTGYARPTTTPTAAFPTL